MTPDDAVSSARAAFPTWSARSLDERAELLAHYANRLESSPIAELISLETGKPLWESKTEVAAMIGKVAISLEAYKERCPVRTKDLASARLVTRHKPQGVVAVVGPFNFPGHLPNGHIVPALLAGNTVLFKSSHHTPQVAEEMMRCWDHLPQGVLVYVSGGSDVGHAIATHPGIDGLFFTGSYKTGKELAELFSRHPEKILALEMGGNNPLVFVDATDIFAAAHHTILSAYLTAGQRCSCARRLIVVGNQEKYLEALLRSIQGMRVGLYTERPEPFMGPVISVEEMERFLDLQAKLGAQGGVPLAEMRPLRPGTALLSPGLMDVTAVESRGDEEIFAPFLQMIQVDSFEEALTEANNTSYGLTAGIFTEDESLWRRFLQGIHAGVVNWNTQLTGASSAAPFGGVGKSGNHRPSAYYAADYCAYPVASMENPKLTLPKAPTPGLESLANTMRKK